MMYTDIIENDDSERLLKVLSGPLSNSQIYQLAYSSIVNKSYSCMQCVLRHSQLDFYEPFEADGFLLPIIYHAIRLGNLDACKLLLEYGLNPLVCTGLCQLNNTEVICEDVVRFSFHLVKACKNGDYELTDQLLFSPNSLRIRCTIKNFANREFEHLTNFTSSPEVSSNHFKYVHQPVTSLISNSFKSLKFNKYLLRSPGSNLNHHEKEDQRHERQQQQLELFSSEEMLRWNSDESLNSHQLLSLTDLWEWARKQVKPLLLICVQNNYINCMDKLLQVGFQVIPVSSTSERLELNRNFSNVDTNYSKSNNVLKPLVEDIRSVRKQLLWIESVYSNEDSAVHAAIRLNRIDAVKSIIRWDPDSLAITISGNEMGILPIHIACALNRLHCLQLILSMNNVPTSSHFKSQHDANIESTTNVKCCALFSCRIHESPALYRHYYCIDQLDSYHLTAFLLAVIHEHVSIVRELLLFRVKAIKLTHYTELDDYRTDSDFNRDHHRLTVQNIDKFTYSNQFNNNGTNNQQLSPSLDNNIDNMYADICPIDIHRKISACWYFAVTKIHDDNNTNSYISADYNRPIIIMNPRCHQSLDGYAVCGYFNALQLSIMTGNIELLSIMVDYLNREVNTYCTSCIHGQCYAQDNLKPSLQSIITSPLGLACCLAEADENKAVQVASILLNTGAVDISNQLFMYTMRKSFHKLAGLLFIDETLKSIELNKSPIENNEVITKHLNLSNKSLQPSIISNSFWYLSPLMPQWIKLIEDALKFSDSKLSMLYPTSLSSSPSTSVPQSVVKENNKFNHELSKYISQLILSAPPPSFSIKFYNNISCQLITRITMSNCGLQTLPWCLFNCMTNLKELDLSKNHIRHLPRKLPNVPMAYREPQTVSSCWSSSLIYLDLSNNYLEYLPTWLFVNQYEYEHGMMISSNGKPRNCQNNFKENYTHNVFAALNTNGNIDSRCRRRCYSENAINSNNFSSLQHAPLMTDSFAPNLLHLLLSKNQLCTLPCEIWAGSLWCKLEFLDLSWNKISYLPFPNLLKVQFEHSRRMYKQSLHMKTQCLQKTNQGQSINSTVQYSTFNSESILLPTDHISTPITNHHQSVKNCNNNDDEIFERRSVHSFYSNGHTSHLTHLWLHHNCLKSLRLTNPTISNHSTIRTHSSRLPQNFSLAQICPNLVYLDASYNSIENLLDLFFCPECIVHIDLSYNQMKIPDRQQQLQQNSLNNSSSSLSCQFGSSTSILSINMGLYDKNASNFLSHLLHGWNTNKSTRRSYFSKLEHLNLRGNQFHLFTCCANTLSNLSSEFK
ncbi:ankyrin repeat-like protein, partial [Schistosoma japonicum]